MNGEAERRVALLGASDWILLFQQNIAFMQRGTCTLFGAQYNISLEMPHFNELSSFEVRPSKLPLWWLCGDIPA